jgi:hypothetical protein
MDVSQEFNFLDVIVLAIICIFLYYALKLVSILTSDYSFTKHHSLGSAPNERKAADQLLARLGILLISKPQRPAMKTTYTPR